MLLRQRPGGKLEMQLRYPAGDVAGIHHRLTAMSDRAVASNRVEAGLPLVLPREIPQFIETLTTGRDDCDSVTCSANPTSSDWSGPPALGDGHTGETRILRRHKRMGADSSRSVWRVRAMSSSVGACGGRRSLDHTCPTGDHCRRVPDMACLGQCGVSCWMALATAQEMGSLGHHGGSRRRYFCSTR